MGFVECVTTIVLAFALSSIIIAFFLFLIFVVFDFIDNWLDYKDLPKIKYRDYLKYRNIAPHNWTCDFDDCTVGYYLDDSYTLTYFRFGFLDSIRSRIDYKLDSHRKTKHEQTQIYIKLLENVQKDIDAARKQADIETAKGREMLKQILEKMK